MADWKRYISNGYAGCQLLAYAWDHCRKREVRIYKVPGETEAVGISDGVDAWIAPVAPSLFSVDVLKIMRDLHDGIMPKPVKPGPRAARVKLIDDAPRKRTPLDEPTTGGKTRVQLA